MMRRSEVGGEKEGGDGNCDEIPMPPSSSSSTVGSGANLPGFFLGEMAADKLWFFKHMPPPTSVPPPPLPPPMFLPPPGRLSSSPTPPSPALADKCGDGSRSLNGGRNPWCLMPSSEEPRWYFPSSGYEKRRFGYGSNDSSGNNGGVFHGPSFAAVGGNKMKGDGLCRRGCEGHLATRSHHYDNRDYFGNEGEEEQQGPYRGGRRRYFRRKESSVAGENGEYHPVDENDYREFGMGVVRKFKPRGRTKHGYNNNNGFQLPTCAQYYHDRGRHAGQDGPHNHPLPDINPPSSYRRRSYGGSRAYNSGPFPSPADPRCWRQPPSGRPLAGSSTSSSPSSCHHHGFSKPSSPSATWGNWTGRSMVCSRSETWTESSAAVVPCCNRNHISWRFCSSSCHMKWSGDGSDGNDMAKAAAGLAGREDNYNNDGRVNRNLCGFHTGTPRPTKDDNNNEGLLRHGRVQSVKFLSDDSSSAGISGGNGGVRAGKSATVAFIDIRSAAKALRSVHSMAGHPLQISYHEPGSVPPRIIQAAEHSSPGDSIAGTGAGNETGTNPVSSLPTGNTSSVSGPGITNGPNPNVSGPGLYRQQRFPVQHGQSEDSSSHFYDQPKGFSRGRGDGHGFHGTRGRREHRHPYHNNRHSFPGDRNYRMSWGYPNEGRFAPPAHSEVDERTSGPPPPTHPPQNDINSKGNRRPDSPASSVSSRHLPSKRHKSRSMSESGSSDRGSSGGSRSRSGSRSSVSSSVSSGRSRSPPHHSSSGHYSNSRGGSPGGRFHQNSYSRHRYSRSRLVSRPADSSRVRHSSRSPPMAASPSSSASSSPSPHRKINAAPHSPSHSPSSAKSYSPSRSLNPSSGHHHHHHRRTPNTAELQSAIRIRNLPIRSSDTSLKDGLYHEYKKHGKVSWVRVIGAGSERFAIVCFKSSEHATRAVALSQDKQFFGCKIQVSAYYSSRGDEPLGGTDDDNRGLGDEEPSSVSYPTRTVLITGLDATVTPAELRTAFDQYGDIVTIDIRKQGASTHAVCEFVDIASAIRAQWGRHMFKSREARISFYRASPTSSLLLDGTDGVNEKQITGHCSQYGAITRVIMDTDRILALVQFDEISSAQTAIRELRNWIIKGKTLHVDFASPDCIRMFLERIACRGGTLRGDNSSPSLRISTTPPLPNSTGVIPLKEGRRSNRRLPECPDERRSPYSIYRHTNDVEFEGAKPMTQLRLLDESGSPESASSLQLRQNDVGNMGMLCGDENMLVMGGMACRRRNAGYTSPVSPDPDHNSMDEDSSNDIKGKVDHCKIDLSCHETDSAVVTSSSDVIMAENDTHTNHHDSLNINGDGKHMSYEFVRVSCNSNAKSHVAVTVDGVSSTSPEPKTETVRKASPDPGIGFVESAPRIIGDPHIITSGLTDPRKKPNESKIRRSSADSGSNSTPSAMFGQHSSNGGGGSSATTSNYSSSSVVNHCNHIASEGGGDESDDRPGTPLCDENPESFVSAESASNSAMMTKLPARSMSQSSSSSTSKNDQPLSLPLPGFALQQRFSHYNNNTPNNNHTVGRHNSASTVSSRDPMMIRLSRSSSDTTVLKSPIKSPAYDGGASVMNSSASECDIFSPSSHSETTTSTTGKTVISDRLSNNTRPLLSSSNASTNNNNSNNTANNITDSYDSDSPDLIGNLRNSSSNNNSSNGDSEENSSRGLSVKNGGEDMMMSVLVDSDSPRTDIAEDDAQQGGGVGGDGIILDSSLPSEERQAGVGSSSDSESGSSPRRSPTGASLEQRIQKFYERYDQWNGIRTTVRSTVPLHQGAMATLDNLGKGVPPASVVAPGVDTAEPAASSVSRFVRTKHKVLDLDEMRHQPSDIVKSLLAKKSVFDEDTKRLENFGEKYEAKPVSIAGGNWRLALNRSSSTASTSSTTSNNSSLATPLTPTTPSATPTPSFPSPSTPTCSSAPGIPARIANSQLGGVHLPPATSPVTKTHLLSSTATSMNHFPPGPPGLTKPGTKDLSNVSSNPNSNNSHWSSLSTSSTSSGHGKTTTAPPMKPSASPTGTSKSTNSTTTFPSLLPNVKPQTEVPNKSQALLPVSTSSSSSSSSGKHGLESTNGTVSTSSPSTTPSSSSSSGSSRASSSGKSPLISSGSLPSTPGVQSGVHHGIPRMVERSMSLDSKRSLSQVPAAPNASSSAGCSPNSASPSLSSSSTPTDRSSSGRRVSVDHPSTFKEVQLPRNKPNNSNSSNHNNDTESIKVSKEVAPLTKERIAKVVQAKDEMTSKSMGLIKVDGPMVHPHGQTQETMVAVVATVQTPMIAPKDAKKDSREKKQRRSSGASTPVQSNPNPPNDKPEGTTSAASSKPSSSSGKESKERKEKEVKKTSGDDSNTGGSNSQSQHSSSGAHHHGKNRGGSGSTSSSKEKIKEERDHGGDSNSSVPPSGSKESSHTHRKDKEKEISKMKRRLSSQDSEQAEVKKPKIERKENHSKDSSSEQSHNSHRSKHNSTNERRESRDSSSSAKDRSSSNKDNKPENKERDVIKSESSTSAGNSTKDKDQHHRSKTSSSSSSSSSTKHHHHGDKEKSKGSNNDGHTSSYSHKSSSEASKKKDKVSPCKENSGKSKHSSSHHSSSHHSASSSSKKEGTGSSSGKSRSSSSKDKDNNNKVKEKHGSTAVDTDDDNTTSTVVTTAPATSEKEKDRDKNRDRDSKHDKRESSTKRDRHKSGGDSSVAGGDKTSSSRSKQEQKKKRRYVIDESDSSDSAKSDEDEDENKKHHSIFEVIVDEYVSMYDKVKARSNRACKNQPTAQQQKEEQRKQEKLKEQFQQLKQSRAKREEKKRSTSIEDRKSFVNSSSDDESHPGVLHNDSDAAVEQEASKSSDRDRERRDSVRELVAEQSSDDEMHHNHKTKNSASRTHQKSKSRSSKGKTKQKGRKSNKISPSGTSFPSSSSIFFSHSDEDSHTSSPPVTKKIKLKHQFTAVSTASSVSHQSLDTKSSDESISDYDDSNVIMSNVKGSSSKSKFASVTSRSSKKLLRTTDIYSDSDSSVRSNRTNKNLPVTPTSKGKSSRDKVVKQKSMDIKKLFDDSSDSSGGEETTTATTIIKKENKEKEIKDELVVKNRTKDKDNKENKSSSGSSSKKKHHSSVSSSKSSSNKASRRQRVSSGDTASCDTQSGIHPAAAKRDSSSNMKDMLFGSMTPSSSSDVDEKPSFADERPKTPTPIVIPPSSGSKMYDETPVSSKSKSKTSRSKQRKSSSSLAQTHSSHGSHSSVDDVSMDSTLVTPPVTSSSGKTSSSEKKKKRHHRERRSKRTESQDTNISSSVHSTTPTTFDQIKVKTESVDLDSLFNSPAPSPKLVLPKTEPITPAVENPMLKVDIPPANLFGTPTSQLSPMLDSLKSVKEKEKSTVDMDDCVANMKSMFSTDEDDDDDDNKLKIDINEAIMASDDQHDDLDSEEQHNKEDDSEQKRRAEEEEKKLHCLFEQDKAIESIVNDRKTPPVIVTEEDLNPKDEIPKDETAISQEETEDAVAALLETLEGDDTINEDSEAGVEKSVSPPTLRIIEEGPSASELEPESLPPPVDIPIPDDEKGQSWYDTKSPKELQIDEAATAAATISDIEPPHIAEEPADIVRRSSVDSIGANSCPPKTPEIRCSDDEQKLTKIIEDEISKPSSRAGSRKSSRNDSSDVGAVDDSVMHTSSADVYEFHDSDDEGKNGTTQPLAHAKPMVAPPVKSPCLTVKVEEGHEAPVAKILTPPTAPHVPVIPKTEASLVQQQPAVVPAPTTPAPPPPLPPVVIPPPPTIQAPPAPKPVVHSPTVVIKSEPSPMPKPLTPVTSSFQQGSRTPPVAHAAPVRTTVDDTIDEVIRMVQADALLDSPSLTPSVPPPKPLTARARSRSRSKDAQDEVPNVTSSFVISSAASGLGGLSKVIIAKPAEGSPRRSNSNTPAPPPSIPASVLTAVQHNAQEMQQVAMVKSEKEDSGPMEMIDPKTGILIPMVRQSDEYIPVMTQSQDQQQPTHQLHQHHLQISQSRTADIISKAMEQRPGMEQRPTVLASQQHPAALSKSEGLPAVLAQQQLQQQQQQQQHLVQQQKHLLLQHFQQQPQPPHIQQQLSQAQHHQQGQHHQQQQVQHHQTQHHPQAQHLPQVSQHQQQQQQVSPHHVPQQPGQLLQPIQQQQHGVPKSMVMTHCGMAPKTAVIYTSSGPGFMQSKPGYPQPSVQPTAVPSSSPNTSVGYKPPTLPQMSKPSFTSPPLSQPSQQQNVAYHHVTVVRPNDQMPGQGPPPRPTLTSNAIRPPHNIQAQLVRIPQVPSALTITKVNAGEEQERKSAIIQHPNVILTASSAPPVSSVGLGGPSVVRAVVPPAHPHQHAQQPVQIQHAELLRMGRIMGEKDPSQLVNRSQEAFGPTPRVDVGGSVVVTASPSPKAGRVPQQHEQTPPPPTQQRVMAQHHPMNYDPAVGDVRVLPHGRQPTDSAHYMPSQGAHQVVYSTQYIPVSVAGSIGSAPGQQSPYAMRGVPGDKIVQQDKRGTPELHKGGATLTLINPERGVPQPVHHIPPHLASPHAAEARSSESPLVATVYAGQRQLYGTPVPAHQPPPPSHLHRQTFSNPYAELEEGRYSNSPSYHQYDTRAVLEREREPPRVPSPYTSAAMVTRRPLSPPPAHSARYAIHPTGEAPTPADRQRPPPSPTPPHGSQVPAQREDSLLMLLQRYPIMWQGLLALKNDNAACQMHFVSGNLNVARESLPTQPDGTIPPLRISQRMRLEQTQLEGVARKMQIESEHCMLLALPCGRDHMDVLQQSNNLRNGFITYLQLKQAAGIVNILHPHTQQPAYVIHIFPSCDFANENLARIAPDLLHGVADIAHLLIVIATV